MTKKSKKSTAKQKGDAFAYGKLKTKVAGVPTPKQQREAGVITGVMVGQALGGMFGPRHLALSKKAAEKTDDVVAAVVSKIKPKSKARKIFEKETSQKLTKEDFDISPSKQKETNARLLEIYKKTKKAKGGYVKKYAKGGGVRKAR